MNIKIIVSVLVVILLVISIFYFIPSKKSPQCYGLYIGQDLTSQQVEAVPRIYGEKPAVILTFVGWSDRPFNRLLSTLNAIKSIGAIPMITLEPWMFPSKVGVSLVDIAQDKENKTIKDFATVLKKYKEPVFIRFAHEVNGNWYPWSGDKNKEYIKAWRKVHDTVTEHAGSTKISWVWSINVENLPEEPWNIPINYYPGNAYVDAIGIDGYNWGKTKDPWSGWKSFDRIFKTQIKYVRNNFKKQIFITEMASTTMNEERAGWIKDFFNKFSRKYSYVPLFIWFNVDKELRWNLGSDKNSLDAFKKGLNGLILKEPSVLIKETKDGPQ